MQPERYAVIPSFFVGVLFPLFALIVAYKDMGEKGRKYVLCLWAILLSLSWDVALYFYPLQQDVSLFMDFLLVTGTSAATVVVGVLTYVLLFVIGVLLYAFYKIARGRRRIKFGG
ncbi:MAG: hypothetical protein U1D26_02445 [Patescibacteria group bacterium]|nr:hypothetical protein [Patescibacteria group bacterium]